MGNLRLTKDFSQIIVKAYYGLIFFHLPNIEDLKFSPLTLCSQIQCCAGSNFLPKISKKALSY